MMKLISSVVKGVKKNELVSDLWFILFKFNFFEWGTGLIDFARFFSIFAKYKFKLLQIICESRTFFRLMSSFCGKFFSLFFELTRVCL